jgi:hypothetical protein
MKEFEPLIGEWHGEGEVPIEPPMRIYLEAKVERLGEFRVWRSAGEPAEVPDSVAIIGGAREGGPQPMHYFDSRGGQADVSDESRRLFVEDLAGPRRGLERPGRPWLQPALHRGDLG